MRTAFSLPILALLLMASVPASAVAEPCVVGTNRPGIDVNPARRIDPNAPRMHCEMTNTIGPNGRPSDAKQWVFTIK